jgi:hypothetical protein
MPGMLFNTPAIRSRSTGTAKAGSVFLIFSAGLTFDN